MLPELMVSLYNEDRRLKTDYCWYGRETMLYILNNCHDSHDSLEHMR